MVMIMSGARAVTTPMQIIATMMTIDDCNSKVEATKLTVQPFLSRVIRHIYMGCEHCYSPVIRCDKFPQ